MKAEMRVQFGDELSVAFLPESHEERVFLEVLTRFGKLNHWGKVRNAERELQALVFPLHDAVDAASQ